MKLVYIAGPYRADTINGVYENIQRARIWAVQYWRKGYAVICPHLNTQFFDGGINGGTHFSETNIFLEGDFEMLRRCDKIVMIPGWTKSEGAKKEHEMARHCGIEVIYEGEDWTGALEPVVVSSEPKSGTTFNPAKFDGHTGIAISGKAKSGKDTLAQMLLERLGDGWRREAFADALKVEWYDGCFSWQPTPESKEHKIEFTNKMKSSNVHVRQELIDLGQKHRAEDPDYWIKRVDLQSNCIITDLRFWNEFKYLKARGFLMVRVECTFETLCGRGCPPINDPSECELDNRLDDFDVVVSNNAGLEVLERSVAEIVQTLYSCR